LGFSASTDNRGNAFVFDRLMSTKWPLAPVLCELAAQLRRRGAQMWLKWIPRESNQPADDLSNMKFDRFELVHRVPVDVAKLDFIVLAALLAAGAPGAAASTTPTASSAAGRAPGAATSSAPLASMPAADVRPLRVRQPW